MKKAIQTMLAAALLFLLLSFPSVKAAEAPYSGYQYNAFETAVPAPVTFTADSIITPANLQMESFADVTDIIAGEDGLIHVLKSDTGEVYRYDRDFKLVDAVRFSEDGKESAPVGATGMFLREGYYYIVDPQRFRSVKADRDGNIVMQFLRPESNIVSTDYEFLPSKILTDSQGIVYVIVKGMYDGAVTYTKDGEFIGYFGSGNVPLTAKVLFDYFWKGLLNQSARSHMLRYVPIEFVNFDIDSKDFIYTVTSHTENLQNQIQCFNAQSTNILPDRAYGESDASLVFNPYHGTAFMDIKVLPGGMFAALDSQSGRVLLYNKDGEWMTSFGGIGVRQGLFLQPMILENVDGRFLVLDQKQDQITVFSPTRYGKNILNAVDFYNKGDYAGSKSYWEDVLKQNGNCSAAYVGIGKALMGEGEYGKAMEYFKLGKNQPEYSNAFESYRKVLMRRMIVPFLAVLTAVILLILRPGRRKAFVSSRSRHVRPKNLFEGVKRAVFHPNESFDYVLESRSAPILSSGILLFWVFSTILQWLYTGFVFNLNEIERFNIFDILMPTLVVFAVFCICNWLLSAMLSGSGKMKDIITVCAVSLLPFIASLLISTVISNILLIGEGVFINFIAVVCTSWSAVLLISGLKKIHEFTVLKTLFMFVCTIAGMALMAFVGLLAWSLFQQVGGFVSTVFDEVSLMLFG